MISQGATTPGYYYTRSYTVSVPYQVWVPPTGNGGEGGEGGEGGTPGYWKTEYRQETRYEQVWVNAVTPRPGMSHTTATYGGLPGPANQLFPQQHHRQQSATHQHQRVRHPGRGGVVGHVRPERRRRHQPPVGRADRPLGQCADGLRSALAYWITRYTYNAANQDHLGNPTQRRWRGGRRTRHLPVLRRAGQQRRHARRQRQPDRHGYDAGGKRIVERHADGGVYRYGYNGFGDKISWTDALGNVTSTPMTGWAA